MANFSHLEESVELVNPYCKDKELKKPKIPKINQSAAKNAAAKASKILQSVFKKKSSQKNKDVKNERSDQEQLAKSFTSQKKEQEGEEEDDYFVVEDDEDDECVAHYVDQDKILLSQ